MPAPTSLSSVACSWISTSTPRLSSASAAVSPPMPAPMMITLSGTKPSASMEKSRLFYLNAGRFHDLAPARGLLGKQTSIVLRRANLGVHAEPGHGVLHFGGAQDIVDRGV